MTRFYPDSFYKYETTSYNDVSDERINAWIKEGVDWLNNNPEEEQWSSSSGNTIVIIHKEKECSNGPVKLYYNITVAKNYLQSYLYTDAIPEGKYYSR
jgi:hypothetical protein